MKKHYFVLAGKSPQQAAEIDHRNQELLDSLLETDLLKIPGCHRSGNGVHFI